MSVEIVQHHLTVPRTARYFTCGPTAGAVRELWFLLHGYGQLADQFLLDCEALAAPDRLLIACEGQSRFYLDSRDGAPARRVGASWMTREDRLTEIDDYVGALDLIYTDAVAQITVPVTQINVLAFSQGTATACRWLARGSARVGRLVLWAGEIPPDLDLAQARARFAAMDLLLVAGTRDQFITSKILERETARLTAAKIEYKLLQFAGAHVIDGELLRKISDPC
ncbi:MAG TPA: hypothetical protein VLV45_10315 [Gemmatimonadales bacterium]|nr:hypothetical protein [Gemmatimonadales bacterium]